MITVLRGTSGSGKTHIAAEVMRRAGVPDEKLQLGKKIGGYVWLPRHLALVGKYETACGGCDSYSWKGAADDIEALVIAQAADKNVLLEGLMVSTWGADRLLRMAAHGGLTVLHLTTPLQVCLESVTARRNAAYAAKGKTDVPPLNPYNTTTKHASLITHTRNQRKRGVVIEEHDRASALARTLELLGFSA